MWYKSAQTSAWGTEAGSGARQIYHALRERSSPHQIGGPELDKIWGDEIKKVSGYVERWSNANWAYIDYDPQKRKVTDNMNPLANKGMEWKLYFTLNPQDGSKSSMERVIEALKDLPRQLEANLGQHGVALMYKIPGRWSDFLRENDTLVIYHPFEPRSEWTAFITSVVRGWMGKWSLEEGKRSYNEGFDWREKTQYKNGTEVEHTDTKEKMGWLSPESFIASGLERGGGSFGTTLSRFIELVHRNPNDPRWAGLVKGSEVSMKEAADWLIGHGKEVAQELAK
jgi:hypothetical protein